MTKSVLIEYGRDVDGHGKGERFVLASAAKAGELHPHAKIVSYESGEPYEEPKPRADRSEPEAPAKADKAAEGKG